jgi:multisubunit Na+/H+ antiporter MnhG subunit
MEDYPYDIGKRYAEIIEIMWFTYLYSSLIPIGAMLALIGFIMYYFIDKYNLLRRSSIANTIESKLSLLSIRLMEMTLVWKPVG